MIAEPTKREVDELIGADEAASILRCNRRRLRELVNAGHLPAVRLGPKIVRISRRELAAFIRRGGASG